MGMTERMPVDSLQASPLCMQSEATFFLGCPQQAEHPRESQIPRHSENDPLHGCSALSIHVRLPEPTELRVCLHVSWVFQNVLCSKFPLQARFLEAGRSAPIAMQGFHQFANRSLSQG
jgi:hypothetical protein